MPNVYQRKGSEVWHYSFTVDGERYRRSAETDDKRLAEDIAIKHEALVRRAVVHGEEAVLTFPDAVAEYLDDGKDGRFLAKLIRHFKGWKVKDINGPEIRKAAKIIYPDASPATWNRQVITPMRAVINHIAEAKRLPKISVKRFKEEKKRRPAGNTDWLSAFSKTAKALDMPETAALARFLFETATRVSEACRLTWDDVNLQLGVAFLERTKNGEGRKVFLTRAMVVDLANIRSRHPTLVFAAANRSTVKKRIDKVITAAKLPRLTSHEFGRHGFATEMIVRNGVDVATTADHGGWKSRRLLMEIYVEGDADREVIDRVFGKKKSP
ncbi:integrase [Rhizobium leguminosarum]|uniref:tyrosine-type recombinase/integrase n=1 Tax=Rhizobium leguminosarum TaxID=384 RepID=UPI00160DC1B6|nr:tyrosine-type recombinase/integrase [Rhizobium leguminosarum]MBB5663208.1 integrase [Rhizobium leguminosarum]